MSIQTQKIIRFVPVINLVTLVFLFKSYFCKPLKETNFIKIMLMMFVIVLSSNIPRLILHFVFENIILDEIMYIVSICLLTVALSWVAVHEQERLQSK